jgi:hypothetical protein
MNDELTKHKEEFAAAFLQKTGLDPTMVVMICEGHFPNQTFWFRPKTKREIELETKSENTLETLRYCPECPCENCKNRRNK